MCVGHETGRGERGGDLNLMGRADYGVCVYGSREGTNKEKRREQMGRTEDTGGQWKGRMRAKCNDRHA